MYLKNIRKVVKLVKYLQDTSELVFFKVTYPAIFDFNFCMNIP